MKKFLLWLVVFIAVAITAFVVIRKPVIAPHSRSFLVFFMNDRLDPEVTCQKTFPVQRQIIKTQEIAYLALTELLKGPTPIELQEGYMTAIPSGVHINSLELRDSTFYVDFNDALEYMIGGSCRVLAIRHQITDTLKQFSSIKDVVISINGRTEDILQP